MSITTNETLEWTIINDGYVPTRKEVLQMAEELLELKKANSQ